MISLNCRRISLTVRRLSSTRVLKGHRMVSESQIFRQIERLLVNRISLDAFEDWLVRSSWNMHLDSGSKAQSLVWKIELSLAEIFLRACRREGTPC